MAVRRHRHKHGKGGRRKHVNELSALLAPPEEQTAAKAKEAAPGNDGGQSDHAADDTIVVDSKNIKLPEKFIEEEDRDATAIFKLEPVVVFILVAFLSFVAFVAWQITKMPPPPAN